MLDKVSGDGRAAGHFRQRVSLAIQRGIAVAAYFFPEEFRYGVGGSVFFIYIYK